MPGRHDAPSSTGRRWVPTAFDAVVAATPATSLVAALGLAGGGYLDGREDIAACGAVVGAFGLAVERLQTRQVRVRLRRARAEHRSDLQEVTRLLQVMQRDLADLRTDLDDVRAERDAVRAELVATRGMPVPTPVSAPAPAPVPAPVARAVAVEPVEAVPVLDLTELLAEAPAAPPAERPGAPREAAPVTAEAPRLPLSLILPGQVRSPIATGGIPLLAPGPSAAVRPAPQLRAVRPDDVPAAARADGAVRDDRAEETQPIPVITAELADALVYAAMAEADAAELTRSLDASEGAAGRDFGALHTGDAHHAGDYARDEYELVPRREAPTLYVVRRGKHVA